MWQSSNKNSKIIIIALFIIGSILLFSLFRDNSESINKKVAVDIIENQLIQKATVAEPYIYIQTEDKIYKVAKEAIDIDRLFDKTLVEYEEESTSTIDILLLIIMIIFTLYIVSMIRENRDRQDR